MAKRKEERKAGIYGIVNLNDGRVYVGQAQHIWLRCEQHFRAFRRGDHRNPRLQRAYNRDGESAFRFFIIEFCDMHVIDERETFWIAQHDKKYNVCLEGSSRRGVKASDEARSNMSAAKKGKKPLHLMTPESRKRAAATYKARWHEIHPAKQTPETIAKRVASQKARWAIKQKTNARIPADVVLEIFNSVGKTYKSMAKEFGVSIGMAWRIKNGLSRKVVTNGQA